jgi:hypothetical protein
MHLFNEQSITLAAVLLALPANAVPIPSEDISTTLSNTRGNLRPGRIGLIVAPGGDAGPYLNPVEGNIDMVRPEGDVKISRTVYKSASTEKRGGLLGKLLKGAEALGVIGTGASLVEGSGSPTPPQPDTAQAA